MKLIADENVEVPLITYLRQQGHHVVAIAEFHAGIPDEQVLTIATQEHAVLLTSDHDFGQMIFALRHPAPFGVILMRLPDTLTSLEKAQIVASVIAQYEQNLPNAFIVISATTVRITPMP